MPSFDILVKGGTLPSGSQADVGIIGDRIAAVGQLNGAEARTVIDATGDLVSPPFVDPHFHMDATLSYGTPRINASGTLLEGIGLWGELKQITKLDQMVDRGKFRQAIAHVLIYAAMFDAFSCIDLGGEGPDDRKIQLDEWVANFPTVSGRGFQALQDWALADGMSAEEKVR